MGQSKLFHMAKELIDLTGLKAKLGVEWEPFSYPVERGAVYRFIRAIGDTNPCWQGGAIAPPTFVLAIGFEEFVDKLMALVPFGTLLMGSTELESYQPIRAGDEISVIFKLSSLREREGKMGRMVFMSFDSTYQNQAGQLVAKLRQMVIGY